MVYGNDGYIDLALRHIEYMLVDIKNFSKRTGWRVGAV